MIRLCKSCNNEIPNARINILPNVQYCVNCSNEAKVSAIPVIHHKTGNEIQIVRDPEVAAEFHKLSSRIGFGTLRGLKAGKSGGTEATITIRKREVVFGDADVEYFNKLGEHVMYVYDLLGAEKALDIIRKEEFSRTISTIQASKLKKIVNALNMQPQI